MEIIFFRRFVPIFSMVRAEHARGEKLCSQNLNTWSSEEKILYPPLFAFQGNVDDDRSNNTRTRPVVDAQIIRCPSSMHSCQVHQCSPLMQRSLEIEMPLSTYIPASLCFFVQQR